MKKSYAYQSADRSAINLTEFALSKCSSARIHRLSLSIKAEPSSLLVCFLFQFSLIYTGFSCRPFVSQRKRVADLDFFSRFPNVDLFISLWYCCGLAMGKKGKKGQGSSVYPVGDDEARSWLRHRFLMQDYKQLWMETEAKKKRLMLAMKKKLELVAEIRFLRRKLKSFLANPSQTRPFKLKTRYSDDILPSLQSPKLEKPANLKEDFLYEIQEERKLNNALIPQMVNQNQIFPTYKDGDANEPMGSNIPTHAFLADGRSEISVKDANLLKCRDAKNGANRVKWRNPVVSMVNHLPLH